MQSKLKKLFAVLILTGAVLAFCSPAMARFSEVGDTINFAGYNWILYKKDANSGYLIAKGAINDTPFKADGSSNKYNESDLRKKVNECERIMRNYTGPQLTWDCVNGTADGKNYIEKHDMTEKDRNPGFSSMNEYDDLLYVLSFYEAAEAFEARKVRSHFQEDGNDVLGWLRSTNPKSTKTGCYVLADQTGTRGSARDSFDLEYVIKYRVETNGIACPALQISLDSPIFTKTDGQSDSGEVKPFNPINPHGEEEQGKQEEQKAVWKVGGEWNYTITLPEFTDTFDGVPVKISAEQTGNITITAADSEKEAGKERIAGGAVESVRSSLKYELPDGTVETFSSYFEGPMDLGEKFKKDPYNPGEEVSFTAPLYYDTHEGKQQIVGYMTATYSQTKENKFEGTVTLSKTPGGTPIASGIFEAAKRSKDSSSGCNAGFGAFALLGVLGMFYRKK